MRDSRRIAPLLLKFANLWYKHPDLRFMQVVSIIQDAVGEGWFYVEDEQIEDAITDMDRFLDVKW